MAQDTKTDIAGTQRHVYGPRPVGALVPRLTRPAFRRMSAATAQVMADWISIVGPALAAVTAPQRLSAGQLTIACSGPIAMELQHLATELIGRINTHLGGETVKRLRFVQAFQAAPAPATPPPPAPLLREAQAAVAHLPDGPLRDALAALGGAVFAAAARDISS